MSNEIVKVEQMPKLAEIMDGSALAVRSEFNSLNMILNQEPNKAWISNHPTVKIENAQGQKVPLQYLPIERVEYLLTAIYGLWRVEIKSVQLMANSVVVVVRLHVLDPVTSQWNWSDGVGGSPIQIKKDSGGAIDFANMQSAAIQMCAPSAESYAISDAADKLGKIFGKDLNRKNKIDYMGMLATQFNEVPALPQATIDKIIAQGKQDINAAKEALLKPFKEEQKQQIRKALNLTENE